MEIFIGDTEVQWQTTEGETRLCNKVTHLGRKTQNTRGRKQGLQCYLTPWSLLTNYSHLTPLVGNFLTL
jgi:hypothetical protein